MKKLLKTNEGRERRRGMKSTTAGLGRALLVLLMVLATGACGSATQEVAQDAQLPASAGEHASLLDPICSGRPSAPSKVLAEGDVGGEVTDASGLLVGVEAGILYVEPSTDDKVHWAARKWVLAKTSEIADKALQDIKVTSETKDGNLELVADLPDQSSDDINYQLCMVVKAPAAWRHYLETVSGIVESVDHEGDLEVKVSSGTIDIRKKGYGKVKVTADSATLALEANSAIGVELSVQSGTVDYYITDGGVPFKNDSSITATSAAISLGIASAVGLHLDAETGTGSIMVSEGLQQPQDLGTTGARLVTDINGGGAVLTVRAETGVIDIEVVE